MEVAEVEAGSGYPATEWLESVGIVEQRVPSRPCLYQAHVKPDCESGHESTGEYDFEKGPSFVERSGPTLETPGPGAAGLPSSKVTQTGITLIFVLAAVLGAAPRVIVLVVCGRLLPPPNSLDSYSFQQMWGQCKENGALFPNSSHELLFKVMRGSDLVFTTIAATMMAIALAEVAAEHAVQNRAGR